VSIESGIAVAARPIALIDAELGGVVMSVASELDAVTPWVLLPMMDENGEVAPEDSGVVLALGVRGDPESLGRATGARWTGARETWIWELERGIGTGGRDEPVGRGCRAAVGDEDEDDRR